MMHDGTLIMVHLIFPSPTKCQISRPVVSLYVERVVLPIGQEIEAMYKGRRIEASVPPEHVKLPTTYPRVIISLYDLAIKQFGRVSSV